MSDLGALLRKAREQRGYTLDDIQEVTKIRKRYLDAIENGEYKVLPGSFYVRAFVKTYAETVGLDAEEVLRLYHKELPKPEGADTMPAEPTRRRRHRSPKRDRWGKVTVTLLMWLFPILIVAIVYVYLQQNWQKEPEEVDHSRLTTQTADPSPSVSPSVTATPSITPTPSDTPTPPPVALVFEGTGAKNAKIYEVTPAGTHKLEIEVTGRCWVGIYEGRTDKGKQLFQKSIENADAPQTLTFELDRTMFVSVGRADNATIRIGGTEVEDTNTSGPDRFVFVPTTE